MKKLLTALSAVTLTATSASIMVSCTKTNNDNVIIVQMNKTWKPVYEKAIKKVNETFKSRKLDFTVVAKETDIFQEYDQISKKGVKDNSIADVFLLGFDRYQGYVDQNNIKDLSKEIKSVLIQSEEDKVHYGIEIKNDKIVANDNQVVWNTSKLLKNNQDYYGMIPASIENNIWLFDEKKLGIVDGKIVGSEFANAQQLDSTITDLPTLENLIKINNAVKKAKSFFRTVDGFIGGNVLNAYVNKNSESIKTKSLDSNSPSLVWQKGGTANESKNPNDYDSLFENQDFQIDFSQATKTLQAYGKSFQKKFVNAMINQTNDDKINNQVAASLKDGEISMELIAPHLLKDDINAMKQGNKDAKFGIASVGDIKVDSEGKYSMSGFAGGYGWAVKSTIKDITKTDKNKNKVTKTEAAMMFIKEVSQKEYAANWAEVDGKYSAYQENIEYAVNELAQGSEAQKFVGEALKAVAKGYYGESKAVTSRPNTALFDIYWETYAISYRIAMDKTDENAFGKHFLDLFKKNKLNYVFG
ncbi:hypothetical protein [Mesoplasma seiffertii]|uniref:hypothetical protein n=1 Tax=Mesoplasma seiffertii TaxID=28224 RepID=UPI00047B5C7A|nr:hypothetical protein [Mesoplasma seiffertii]